MSHSPESVYLVTREYAGVAEAGGVKNVTRSLAESLARAGVRVTVFLPRYGFIPREGIPVWSCSLPAADSVFPVSFFSREINGVRIILIDAPVYGGKHQVYVYTEDEAALIPGCRRGSGHLDVDVMNILLQQAVIRFAVERGERPDIVHAHDAHAALLPVLVRADREARRAFDSAGFLVTIHNAGPGYRQTLASLSYAVEITGLDPRFCADGLLSGAVEPFLAAANYACLTTVSPWYAEELMNPGPLDSTEGLAAVFRERSIKVTGITNGIDRHRYLPSDRECSLLPYEFDPEKGDVKGKYRCREELFRRLAAGELPAALKAVGSLSQGEGGPLLCYQGRIAAQKGLSVLVEALKRVFSSESRCDFILLGQGDPALEEALAELASAYPGRFVHLRGYDRLWARLAVASADFIVLPSEYEPCGLEDLIAQIYGTLPVARAVGGLRKIRDGETGFLYGDASRPNDPEELADVLRRVIGLFESCGGNDFHDSRFLEMIMKAARRVTEDFDWDRIVRESYIPLYAKNIPSRT